MLRKFHILPQNFPLKRVASYVKKLLSANVALGLIMIPGGVQTNLIIPQQKLDISFNIASTVDQNKIQIPIIFHYMSQGFHFYHPGIDLATDFGTQIKPIKAGVVEEAGYSPFGYGNEILIDNGNGMESLYAHLSKIEVRIGQKVNINTTIGQVGTTGHSTGPHLHLEIHQDGKPINPLTVLPALNQNSSKLITLNQQ
jgi:murein DD-endopeptidase MepM/ murein hydrolase activator NlpD